MQTGLRSAILSKHVHAFSVLCVSCPATREYLTYRSSESKLIEFEDDHNNEIPRPESHASWNP